MGCWFDGCRAHNLVRNEGPTLRQLLQLTTLAGEFSSRNDDSDNAEIGELATAVCRTVDPPYTDRLLAAEEEAKQIADST